MLNVLRTKSKQKLFITSVKIVFACQFYQSFGSATMLSVTQDKFGGVNELYLTRSKPKPVPGPNQILMRIKATALNRADLLMREGRYPNMKEVAPLGLEAAGIVETTNSDKWKVGDKVMALVSGGAYAEYIAVNENHVMPMPAHLNFTEAAGIPEAWLTAYQLLHFIANLSKDETVLIHGGGSGVGTAAIQLVKLAGSQSVVTAGTDKKISFAKSLGSLEGINYKKEEFAAIVKEMTANKGVNVILDCVGGSYWKQNADCLAIEGRWVVYGLLGGPNVDGPLLSIILGKRASLLGTTLKARSDEYKTKLIEGFSKNALPYFTSDGSALKPIIDKIFPIEEVAAAHEYMASNKSNGKIVLLLPEPAESHKEL